MTQVVARTIGLRWCRWPRELQTFVKQRLLPYKYPRTIEYLDTLPKTGTGKLDRQALKALARTSKGS